MLDGLVWTHGGGEDLKRCGMGWCGLVGEERILRDVGWVGMDSLIWLRVGNGNETSHFMKF
jgi:hypothetical protein